MITSKLFARFFHVQRPCLAAEKSLLASLRKKTGYTFANCKKALEMHNNDINQAENWLKKQAQTLGWTKATKLEGRQTTQGLVAVTLADKNAVLVEVNCETDFVARNKEFQKVVAEAAQSCLSFAQKQAHAKGALTKICLDADQLKNLPATDGKPLADHLALMIGTVGENASLRRAFCWKAQNDIILNGYAHPSGLATNNVYLGKFGGLVAVKQVQKCNPETDVNQISKELCQHIVGMNPQKVGSADDAPSKNKDEETCLINQEFLLDDSVTVKDILEENQIEVVDFKRLECGENVLERGDQPLELVETCQ